jgi:hypothetical protein
MERLRTHTLTILLIASCSIFSQTRNLTPTIKEGLFCFDRTQTKYLAYVMDNGYTKDTLIKDQEEQIFYLETIIADQDTIIFNKDSLISTLEKESRLKDSIISNNQSIEIKKNRIIEIEKKGRKKWRNRAFLFFALFLGSIFIQ